MAHLSDGTLRRLYDEPIAVAATAREHFNSCAHCQDRFSAIAGTAREVQSALAVPAAAVDARAAYRTVSPRLGQRLAPWLPRLPQLDMARYQRRALVALAAAALAVGLAVTAVAQGMITIFQPTQVQTVAVSKGSFAGFPDLSEWGTVKVNSQPELQQAATAAAAAKASGLPAIAPKLPSNVSVPPPQYATVSQLDASFTFDKQKADAAAASAGSKAVPLPSNLNGSTLNVKGGPGEVAVYGSIDPNALKEGGNLPPLVIAEAHAPVVTSTGATVKQIEDAVTSQPGVSEQLKAEIKAIGDPSTTLPIPIPANSGIQTSTAYLEDGTKATFLGDDSRIYAGLIFIRKGVVYVVAGSYDKQTLVAVASRL